MPRYWDRDGNEIGFREGLKFQKEDRKAFAEAQRRGRGRTTPGESFCGITLTSDGRVESAQGGGPVAGASAHLDTSGTKAIASRRTMMRTVTPLAVLGQKKMESDTRKCFLVIEGQGWAITEDVPVEQEGAARAFAAQVNAAAGTADAPAAAPTVDVAGQIEKLADLRAKGILTEDEFAGKKAELLARL